MDSQGKEFEFIDNELRYGNITDITQNKTAKFGLGKEVYILNHFVLKLDRIEFNQGDSQLIKEIYRWKRFPNYVKKYFAPIVTYSVNFIPEEMKENYSIRKTKKYKDFKDNFLIMKKLDTKYKTIKQIAFKNNTQIHSIEDIDQELDNLIECIYDDIDCENEVLEPMRKDFSKFYKENKRDEDMEWIEDIIFQNIGYNEKAGIIQMIDYGL